MAEEKQRKLFMVTRIWCAIEEWIEKHAPHLFVEERVFCYGSFRPDNLVKKGDIVIGSLPIDSISKICALGGVYYNIEVDSKPSVFNPALTRKDLEAYGMRLTRYVASVANG